MKTVLIIEDSVELASFWQNAFERHDLYVIHEPKYESAIRILKNTPVDLVITDIALPNETGEIFDFAGLAVLSFIALQIENPPKIIAVSGSAIEQTNQPFLHLLECAQLMQKPFEVERLVKLALKLLEDKATEDQHRQMREEYHLLVTAARASKGAILIAKVGPDQHPGISAVFANQAYLQMTGYSMEETIGRKPRSLEGPETNQDAMVAIADGISRQRSVRVDILLYEKNGTAFWCDLQVTPVPDSSGHYAHWLIAMRDITSMKHAKEALSAVSTSHRAMVELLGSTDGVWDWNLLTDAVEYYPGYRKLLGYKTKDSKALPPNVGALINAIHPDDREIVQAAHKQSISSHLPFECEHRLKCHSGEYIWVHSRGAAVYDRDAQPLRMVGTIYDITQQKNTEQELAQEREMLRRSNSDLEQFAYVASHDLQEPLRAVGGFMQILDQKYSSQLDEKAVGYIRKSVQGAARMQQLINDLLLFSQTTQEIHTMKPVALDEAISRASLALEKKINQRSATVAVGPMPTILGEPTQLKQLFQNLIDNGIKYCSDDHPHIDIVSEETADHWIISVTDNGIGIKPEYRKQIFSIFKRLHRREEFPGTGIGLAICERVVERHGGTISIEDAGRSQTASNVGCRFVLKFPKHKE